MLYLEVLGEGGFGSFGTDAFSARSPEQPQPLPARVEVPAAIYVTLNLLTFGEQPPRKSQKIKAALSPPLEALLSPPSGSLSPSVFLGPHTLKGFDPDHSSPRVHYLLFFLCLNKAKLDT